MLQRLSFRNGQGVDRVCQGLSLSSSERFRYALDKFLALHSETVCHPINFLFAEGWRQLSAAVGTGGAVDPGPNTSSDLKDALVDLVGFQIALSLQEPAKAEILIFSFLGELTDLNEIDGHKFPRMRC